MTFLPHKAGRAQGQLLKMETFPDSPTYFPSDLFLPSCDLVPGDSGSIGQGAVLEWGDQETRALADTDKYCFSATHRHVV